LPIKIRPVDMNEIIKLNNELVKQMYGKKEQDYIQKEQNKFEGQIMNKRVELEGKIFNEKERVSKQSIAKDLTSHYLLDNQLKSANIVK